MDGQRQINKTLAIFALGGNLIKVMSRSDLLSEVQALVRQSLLNVDISTTPSISTSDVGHGKTHRDAEKFRRLIDGIQFSRNFIVTYQLVLLVLLLFLTSRHWLGQFGARRKRSTQKTRDEIQAQPYEREKGFREAQSDVLQSAGSEASNSSSTLHESYAPQLSSLRLRSDEYTPLLGGQRSPRFCFPWTIYHKTKAWLVYQPAPLPFVNKILPSNGTSLVVLALLGVQAFYLLYHVELSVELLFVFADRASLLFVANLPLLYLLAAKNAPINTLTGYSYESINIFHRRLGEVMCLLALLHSAGMIGVWYSVLRPTGVSFIRFLLMRIILLGVGAFVAYEMIYFTSLATFRKMWYELFLALHIVLQILALVLVFFHHGGSRPYVGAALGIFLIDRLFYRMNLKSWATRASLKVMEDGKTTRVCATLARSELKPWALALGSNVSSGWAVMDHVFLSIPAIGRKHLFQAHPFTIASTGATTDDDRMNLRLIIRAQDGFSSDLLQYAKSHSSAVIRMDGPYGSQSAINLMQDCENAVLVAGGSGIAPIWPLLSKLMFDARSSMDAESHSMPRVAQKILFIWVVREASHVSWLGEAKIDEARQQDITVIIPPPTAIDGHPNVADMMSAWIADLKTQGRTKTGVVCSGPDSMNRAVRNAGSRLISKGHNVCIEIEKFGW